MFSNRPTTTEFAANEAWDDNVRVTTERTDNLRYAFVLETEGTEPVFSDIDLDEGTFVNVFAALAAGIRFTEDERDNYDGPNDNGYEYEYPRYYDGR